VTGIGPAVDPHLHLWQVPWPPQVESMAMPFHDAESKTVTPGGTRTPRCVGVRDAPSRPSCTVKDEVDPAGAVVRAGSEPRAAIRPSRRTSSRENVGSVGHGVSGALPAARRARWAAIQAPAPLVVAEQQVGGLHGLDDLGVRVSMIALVRPAVIAIGRNAAPSVWRAGIPKDTLEAPQVMFTPNSSRMRRIVSQVC
jgi:hypothetical protein